MSVIADHGTIFLWMACIFGFFMAWGVGANDVANAMGTSVGSRALTVRQAIVIAILLESAGAFLAGGSVTSTIRNDIIDLRMPELLANPELLIYGMLASLLASATWLLIATHYGWPVSTTHSIIGAIVGFAVAGVDASVVHWHNVLSIAGSWILSPLFSGMLALLVFSSVQKLILDTESPFRSAKRYIPVYTFLVGFMISMVTLTKGMGHLGLNLNTPQALALATLIGLLLTAIAVIALQRIKKDEQADQQFHYSSVERIFATMMIFTACTMAFAHGSNDVANAVGPLAAVAQVVRSGGNIAANTSLPSWVLLLGASGIVCGLATYGYRVMATIGQHLTELTPSRGFAAEVSAATTVVLASGIGLPVSTTHILVGAVLGVGLARGIGALNLQVIGTVFLSWLVTLPAGALLSIAYFSLFRSIFS